MGPPQDVPKRSGLQARFCRSGWRCCLLKGCSCRFRPSCARSFYCSPACQAAARRWQLWKAQRRYRASEKGRATRREQSRRWRVRQREKQQTAPHPRPSPAGPTSPRRLARRMRPVSQPIRPTSRTARPWAVGCFAADCCSDANFSPRDGLSRVIYVRRNSAAEPQELRRSVRRAITYGSARIGISTMFLYSGAGRLPTRLANVPRHSPLCPCHHAFHLAWSFPNCSPVICSRRCWQ